MTTASKPIFCATHPRACSTAFERVFMARSDLVCAHEPFGDAFYYGPERIGDRYNEDEAARISSGFSRTTYATVFDDLRNKGSKNERLFIKDMAYYIMPSNSESAQIAPSLLPVEGNARDIRPFPYGTMCEPRNPTVIPIDRLQDFHFTFLIRDPHYSIPSYYRCTIPPLSSVTGWTDFKASEVGYLELRRFWDFLIEAGLNQPSHLTERKVPGLARDTSAEKSGIPSVCVIDADDLLDRPDAIIEAYCRAVDLDYDPRMLSWEDQGSQSRAIVLFDKWRGWHDDAINSTALRGRSHQRRQKTEEEFDREWTQKYGPAGAEVIRRHVDANMDSYTYLKQYTIRPSVRD